MARFVDSHAHLDSDEFDGDRAEVLARARAAGVGTIVLVAAPRDLAEAARPLALAETDPDLHATVGVHPHDAARIDESWWPELERLARHPKVVAVGETGLDYHYDHSPRDVQRAAFERQIELARAVGKPVVCHVRDAHDDARDLLDRAGVGRPGGPGGVIHCFTGDAAQAAGYAALGLYVSFSGIATFKTAGPIREAIRVVPQGRMLIETDCPFLAPVPMRGRRNEPAFLVHTAEVVAVEAGLSVDALAELTAANARTLFSLTIP
ncbi:MAG TPA: TatD family hydrolase [Kofleriaceae bacterium]|nr:TatD family hydrolase [Kofleriaceae bacterium]